MHELEDAVLLLAAVLADEVELLEDALFSEHTQSLEVAWRDGGRGFDFDREFLADQKIDLVTLP